MSRPGRSAWFELPARDMPRLMAFYQALLGWGFAPLRDPALPGYWCIEHDGERIGGVRHAPGAGNGRAAGEAPVVYLTVARLGPASSLAVELGGRLEGEPVRMGRGRGAFQRFRDPEDNLLALWAPEAA